MAEPTAPEAQSNINRWSKIATDPLRSFRFLVTFSPAGGQKTSLVSSRLTNFSGGFTNVSGLSINTQNISYREGGFNTTLHQIPGMTTFSPITLQRGTVWKNDQAIAWMRGLFAAAAGEGIPGADGKEFRMDLNIYVLDHPITGAPGINEEILQPSTYKMKFTVYNAWITSLSYSDLNAVDNQLMFETMSLVHEGMTVSFTDNKGNPLKITD